MYCLVLQDETKLPSGLHLSSVILLPLTGGQINEGRAPPPPQKGFSSHDPLLILVNFTVEYYSECVEACDPLNMVPRG